MGIDPKIMEELNALRAENARLRARTEARLSLKLSAKGGVSVYGLGRWPVTLYRGQWERLLGMADAIRAFLAENKTALDAAEKAHDAA